MDTPPPPSRRTRRLPARSALTLSVAVALLTPAMPPAEAGDRTRIWEVSLRAHKGQWVSWQGNGQVTADRTAIGEWEKVDLIMLDEPGSIYLLRAKTNRRYAGLDANGRLVVNRATPGEGEPFRLTGRPGQKSCVETQLCGLQVTRDRRFKHKHITAEGGGGRGLVAKATEWGSWEKFGVKVWSYREEE